MFHAWISYCNVPSQGLEEKLDLQLPVLLVPITTEYVSSIPVCVEVYFVVVYKLYDNVNNLEFLPTKILRYLSIKTRYYSIVFLLFKENKFDIYMKPKIYRG